MKQIAFLFAVMLLISTPLFAVEWTILVYMAADNGLALNAISDINEMEEVGFTKGNLLVQLDLPQELSPTGAKRYRIQKDNSPEITSPIIRNLGQIDSGDYHSLRSFIDWGTSLYPADNYALVIWSHGTGWMKSDSKYVCPDNTSENLIEFTNGDFRSALAYLPHLSLLIMDACNMGSMEIIGEAANFTDYFISSEEEVPTDGFPYNDLLQEWNSNSNPDHLAQVIPTLYLNSYLLGGSQNPLGETNYPLTCSAVETEKYKDLCSKLTAFTNQWAYQTDRTPFALARSKTLCFNDQQVDADLKNFFLHLEDAASDLQLKSDCNAILAGIDSCFIAQKYNNQLGICGTATFYYPLLNELITLNMEKYSNLSFSSTRMLRMANFANSDDTTAPANVDLKTSKVNLSTLYLKWIYPLDVDNLKTNIVLKEDNKRSTIYSTYSDNISIPVLKNGSFTIFCEDETGNKSAADSSQFSLNPPRNECYIFPNPVKNDLILTTYFENIQHNCKIIIYNISGKKVLEKYILNTTPGENKLYLTNITNSSTYLSTGIYTCVFKSDDLSLSVKFAIER